MTNIKSRITTWGAQQRRMPENATAMVERITAASILTSPSPRRSWRFPRLAVGFAVIALVAFFGQSFVARRLVTGSVEDSYLSVAPMPPQLDTGIRFGTAVGLSAPSSNALERFIAAPPFIPYPSNDAPITDTREILDTSYSARMKTRKVEELGSRLQTIIRGFGGRIDFSRMDERYGDIRFALPADKLDALRDELSGMIWKRFLSESVSMENRLPEQRMIEDRTKEATDALARIAEQRVEMKRTYDAREYSTTTEINRLTTELRTLSAQRAAATTDDVRARTDRAIASTEGLLRSMRAALARVRAERTREFQRIDAEERGANERLNSATRDAQALVGRISTVRGTISLEQLSYIRIATTFVTGHWIAILFILLAILAFRRLDRRPLID